MSEQTARAPHVSAALAERVARRAAHRQAMEEWAARLPALPGEARVMEGECAGHLEHRCGPITKCSCGELRNPVSWIPLDELGPPCETCVSRGLAEDE